MSYNQFVGTGIAMVTPFRRDKSIDFRALGQLTEFLINNGVEYLVVLGTTGEASTLSDDEKRAVVSHVKEVNQGRLPIVVGMAGNNTQQLVEKIGHFDFDGIDAILSAAPWYNRPNQRGLYEHYKELAQVAPRPLILYNVPSRTGVNLTAETTVQLAHDFPNIIAVKEAAGDMTQAAYIAKNKPSDFLLLNGNDNQNIPMVALGAAGTISVVGNAYPAQFSEMTRAALRNDYETARSLHHQLIEMIDAMFEDGNPGGVKAVLSMMDIVPNFVRLPLTRVNKSTYAKLQKLAAQIESLK